MCTFLLEDPGHLAATPIFPPSRTISSILFLSTKFHRICQNRAQAALWSKNICFNMGWYPNLAKCRYFWMKPILFVEYHWIKYSLRFKVHEIFKRKALSGILIKASEKKVSKFQIISTSLSRKDQNCLIAEVENYF